MAVNATTLTLAGIDTRNAGTSRSGLCFRVALLVVIAAVLALLQSPSFHELWLVASESLLLCIVGLRAPRTLRAAAPAYRPLSASRPSEAVLARLAA